MTVWVVEMEDNDEVVCCVSSFKAGKQFLLRKGYVDEDTPISDEDYKKMANYCPFSMTPTFGDAYGENWKEVFLQYERYKLADLGFFITEQEVIEEE